MANLTSRALWIFMGDGGAKLFGFLSTIYLARTLGASQYGLLTLAISALGIASWFSDLGLKTLATRSVAGSSSEPGDLARFFWLKILLSAAVLLIAGGITWFLLSEQPQLRLLILLFLLSLLPQSLRVDWYYKGVQEFHWVTLSNWVQGVIYLCGLLLIVSTDDLLLVPWIYSLSILLGALVLLFTYKGKNSFISKPRVVKWGEDLRNSFFLGAGHFFSQSIILLPPLVIGYFFTELQVGYYGVALKLILAAMIIDHVLNTLLLPNLTKLWQNNRSEVQPQLKKVSRWVLLIGVCGMMVLAYAAEPIIYFLFGDTYLPAVPMLILLSVVLPITFINSIFSFGLISFGLDRDFLYSTSAGALGALILIIGAGFTGDMQILILSVVLSELWITICMYYRFRRIVNLKIGGFVLGITTVSALLMALIFLYLTPGIWIAITSPLILFTVLYIFGLITWDDISWMKRRIF
ncbi:hypothetical protein DYD21_06595 [Rhodohalobacter sp. SW132]|uniref:oligosaccharide flippase family protein n=1 Tax=Rhodohalobacter sp. SW132 TaxID=2293433 RepID=UPI000E21DDE0|nr:oligosaccharide flippase family protein [Rhodohalobacter sp. SW132]REL38270.1 hypothetical protein DYD21_06595 [Rhodohalobacter sp. SW132]